jgi:anti-sigma regulatory factor (Ser/Thr protein kinase)
MSAGRFLHEALLYEADDELLAVAVPFLREGVDAGEPTLVRLDARRQELVLRELDDLDGITELRPDHYRDPLSALHAYHRLFAYLEHEGAEHIRVVGAAPHAPWRDWFRYVAASNDVFARFPVVEVCPHHAGTTPEHVLLDIERTHPFLVAPGGRLARSPRYREPTALLAERARDEHDPLEVLPPALLLSDPAPEAAGRALSFLAVDTRLDHDSTDALRLSVVQVVRNAIAHGRPPVCLKAWAAPDRIVATVTDTGPGPANPYVWLLPTDPEADFDQANTLYLINRALTDVSMFTHAGGFTVRLVAQRKG